MFFPLTFRPCLPRAVGQNHVMGRALHLALPSPIWYLTPQPPSLQVPSNPSAKFPGDADNFLKGGISTSLPYYGDLLMKELEMSIPCDKGEPFIHSFIHAVADLI